MQEHWDHECDKLSLEMDMQELYKERFADSKKKSHQMHDLHEITSK